MKGLLFRTNKVKTLSKDTICKLTWKQNYINVIILMIILAGVVFRVVDDESYTMTTRILVAIIAASIINIG